MMNSRKSMCRSPRRAIDSIHAQAGQSNSANRSRRCRGGDRPEERCEELGGNAFYRRHTEGLLRRYVRMSMQIGRVPSCLPREYLPTRNARQGANFEDGVIFVHDMERCLEKLGGLAGELVARIAMQEYSRREAAQMLGMSHGQVVRHYDDAIDQLTEILLLHQLIRESGEIYQRQASM